MTDTHRMSYAAYWKNNSDSFGELSEAQWNWFKTYTNIPTYELLGLSQKEACEMISEILQSRREAGLTKDDVINEI